MSNKACNFWVQLSMSKGWCKYWLIFPWIKCLNHHFYEVYNHIHHFHFESNTNFHHGMWSTVAHSQISCWTIFHWFSIYRFTKWMQTTNSIKALKLFFATSTKLWWVSKCFLNTCIANMLTKFCSWSHRILKWHQGFCFYIKTPLLFAFGGQSFFDCILGVQVVAFMLLLPYLLMLLLYLLLHWWLPQRIIRLWSGGLSCYKLFSCVNSRCHKINLCCTSVLDIQQNVSWF